MVAAVAVGEHHRLRSCPGPASGSALVVRPARAPARTYRRRRVVAVTLAAGVLTTARAALGMLGGETLPASEHPGPAGAEPVGLGVAYVVQPGDTFWSLASRIDPEGDPRVLVDRMVAAHGTTSLRIGERIVLPRP